MSPSICPNSTGPTIDTSRPAPPNWDRVRLGIDAAPIMFVAQWTPETGAWDGGELVPYGPLPLLPAAQVLNYGQSIFEGMRAYRAEPLAQPLTETPQQQLGATANGSDAAPAPAPAADGAAGGSNPLRNRLLLFRPRANAARFAAGAERMCMPVVAPEMFLAAVQAVVRANADWVPPANRGSLYVRPLLLGTGPLLGLCPAPSYTLLVYAVPVGTRAKGGVLSPQDFMIHATRHRAAPRGVGSTKAAGNYSPCLAAQAEARAAGCYDCIYLDARSDTYLEEGSGCNVFVTHGPVISTPPAAGTILPGVTRASLLTLGKALGYDVREAPITVPEALQADEVFASGTAMVVQPIGSLTFRGTRVELCRSGDQTAPAPGTSTTVPAATSTTCQGQEALGEGSVRNGTNGVCRIPAFGYGDEYELLEEQLRALTAAVPPPAPGSMLPGVGPITARLFGLLTGIQYGRIPDPFGWTMEVEMDGPTEGPLHLDCLPELAEKANGGVDDGTEQQQQQHTNAKPGLVAGGVAVSLPRVWTAKTVFADPNLE